MSSSVETIVSVVEREQLDAPAIWPGDPPPGAVDYEHESPTGIVLRAKMTGAVETVTVGTGATEPPVTQVREIAPANLDPGVTVPPLGRVGPEHPWAGSLVSQLLGDGVLDFETPYIDFESAPRVGWQFGEIHSLNESEAGEVGDLGFSYQTALTGPTPSGVTVTYEWTPPRYRWIFAGRVPVRGRQRASGVMGSIPLRGRQGDKWGLRGRQNSNL